MKDDGMPRMAERLSDYLRSRGIRCEPPPAVADGTPEAEVGTEDGAQADVAVRVLGVGEDYALLATVADIEPFPARWWESLGWGRAVRLASESEIRLLFPDCEPEAVPPFGPAYGLPVYASRDLSRYVWLSCPTGRPNACLRLRRDEFERLTALQWVGL